jgi:hypothetical protein
MKPLARRILGGTLMFLGVWMLMTAMVYIQELTRPLWAVAVATLIVLLGILTIIAVIGTGSYLLFKK